MAENNTIFGAPRFGKALLAENENLKAEVERLRAKVTELKKTISDPVTSFGTPELIEWSERLQEIIAEYPEGERDNAAFVFTMGDHLEKFAKSWNSPTIHALRAEIDKQRSATAWQKETIAARDVEIARLREALKELCDGNDLAAERGDSIVSWPDSYLRRKTRAALEPTHRYDVPHQSQPPEPEPPTADYRVPEKPHGDWEKVRKLGGYWHNRGIDLTESPVPFALVEGLAPIAIPAGTEPAKVGEKWTFRWTGSEWQFERIDRSEEQREAAPPSAEVDDGNK